MIPFNVILDNNILQTHFNRYPGSPRHNWQSFHYSRHLFTSEPSQPSETLSNDKCCWTDRLPLLRCLPGEGGDWRGQVASAALSQDRAGHNHGHNSHYPRLIDGGWENVYLAQVCPSVPPSPLLWVSTLLTVGNFTLGPQPAPATSHQPPATTRHQLSLLLSGTSNWVGDFNYRYSSSTVYSIVLWRFCRYSVDICSHPALFHVHPYLLASDTWPMKRATSSSRRNSHHASLGPLKAQPKLNVFSFHRK